MRSTFLTRQRPEQSQRDVVAAWRAVVEGRGGISAEERAALAAESLAAARAAQEQARGTRSGQGSPRDFLTGPLHELQTWSCAATRSC